VLNARGHIEKKYNYFKDKITTAEEFIRYSATKSTMNGEPCRVACNGVGMNSSDWLLAELDKLRQKNLEENHETPDNNPDD
jgi:uridine phosphorylase